MKTAWLDLCLFFEPPLATECIGAVHLFVRLLSPKCKKRDFLEKLSNLELWSLVTTYRKSYMGFLKNPLLDPYNPRWLRSAILKIDMTSFFSAEGGPIWIKFRRLVQNDMSTAVIRGNKTRCRIPIWWTYGRIQWHVIPETRITLQGAATWWIHCHDSRATCHIAACSHLTKSMWSCHIAGCKNSIRHRPIENRFSPYFIFLMHFGLWRAAAFVSSDTLVTLAIIT